MKTPIAFFDPNPHPSAVFAMGSAGHLALVLILLGLLALLVHFRTQLWRLRESRAFMAGTAAFVLTMELAASAMGVAWASGTTYEIIPLHLCASLKIAIAVLVLLERYDLVKYLSIWAIGAGFISFANLNLAGGSFENFAFWHYLVGHYYLFLVPLFLFLTGENRYDLEHHTRSMLGLAVWSLIVFIVNWVFDTNYMYSGPHNETVVPFIPARFMIWPLNYVSYLLVGLILLNGIYFILRFAQDRMDRAVAPACGVLRRPSDRLDGVGAQPGSKGDALDRAWAFGRLH